MAVPVVDTEGVFVSDANVEDGDGVIEADGVTDGEFDDDIVFDGLHELDNDVDGVSEGVTRGVDDGDTMLFTYANEMAWWRSYEPPVPPVKPKKAWQPTVTWPGHRNDIKLKVHVATNFLPTVLPGSHSEATSVKLPGLTFPPPTGGAYVNVRLKMLPL